MRRACTTTWATKRRRSGTSAPIDASRTNERVRLFSLWRQNRHSMKTILDTSPDPADDWATRLTAVTADADLRASGLIEVSIGSLLRVVREQLKLEVVFIGEFVGGARVFRHIASRTEDAVIKQGEGHPLDETICQRIVDGRMPCLT